MYKQYNPNPRGLMVDDCTIRAIACIFNKTWEDAYAELVTKGYQLYDVPTSQNVFNTYLKGKGFVRHIIPNTCPTCYTVDDFSREHQTGEYILATATHVVAIKDGNIYDSWDSSLEIPLYYWSRTE